MIAPLLQPPLAPLSAHGRFWALVPCAGMGLRAVAAGAAAPASASGNAAPSTSTVAAFSAVEVAAPPPTAPLPKQYHLVAGQPMVLHTLAAFAGVGRLLGTLVAVAPGDRFLDTHAHPTFFVVECGGPTRADTVLGGLKALLEQENIEQVTVIGHSMGGAISLRYAADYPQQVNKLIMLDTAGILQRTVFVRHLAQLPESYQWMEQLGPAKSLFAAALGKFNRFADRFTARVLTGLDHLPDPAKLLLALPQAQQYLYKDRANLNAALGLIYEDFGDAIANVSTPTHIIWGEQDKVAPLRTGQLLARQMQQAQLHTIPGAGHVPMSDSTAAFLTIFRQALQRPPERTDWLQPDQSERDFNCRNQRELTISGYYRHINIKDCRYIDLQDVHAESIQVDNSIVSMLNVTVMSPATALSVKNAALTLTNVRLDGKVALYANESRIDAAGLELNSASTSIQTRADNVLYFSVSQMRQNGIQRALHGYSLGDKFALR